MSLFPQAPKGVIMIRPHHFYPNQQTAKDNSFQSKTVTLSKRDISKGAYEQVSAAQARLQEEGVTVHVFEDDSAKTPDSVFPNNWFSTHAGGHVAVYPMYAENRRKERRSDIIELLKRKYLVQDIVDYSGLEYDNMFLEGTGAMVLDHLERVAYAARSKRTDSHVLERFCAHFNYEPVIFEAQNHQGIPVYHTNVLMCIGTEFVMAGLNMISEKNRRDQIIARFERNGRKVIPLSESQIHAFCGNALELQGTDGRILVLSETAYNALNLAQIKTLERFVKLVPLNVSILELSGGSVRCMLAGIHLTQR